MIKEKDKLIGELLQQLEKVALDNEALSQLLKKQSAEIVSLKRDLHQAQVYSINRSIRCGLWKHVLPFHSVLFS